MKRKALALTIILFQLLVNTLLFFVSPVKADSTDFISFPDSGVTIFSPLNMTYYYRNLILNVTLYGAGFLGGLDPQISMNYSIDNIYKGSVLLKSNGEIHVVTTAVGTVALPELPAGSHYLTIYLYGFNQRTYEPKYLSFISTVYFSTVGTDPISSPTMSPTSTPTPSTTTSPSPSPNTTPSPSIPKFPSWMILPLLIVISVGLLIYFKKRKR
jgi:hypothetical protein